MKAGQAELLTALKVAGWGALPWSGEDANRGALRAELECGYTLSARQSAGSAPEVSLSGGGDESQMWSPAMALEVIEGWRHQHAVRAQAAADALAEIGAMIDAVPT